MGGTGRFFDSHMICMLVITILSRVLNRPSLFSGWCCPISLIAALFVRAPFGSLPKPCPQHLQTWLPT